MKIKTKKVLVLHLFFLFLLLTIAVSAEKFDWSIKGKVTETSTVSDYKYSGYICYNCFGTDSWECPPQEGYNPVSMTNPYGGSNDGLCGCPTQLLDSPRLLDSHDHTSTYYCTYEKIEENGKEEECFEWKLTCEEEVNLQVREEAFSSSICYWCFGSDSWECPEHSAQGWIVKEKVRLGGDSDYGCCCPTGLYDSYPGVVSRCDDTTAFYCEYERFNNERFSSRGGRDCVSEDEVKELDSVKCSVEGVESSNAFVRVWVEDSMIYACIDRNENDVCDFREKERQFIRGDVNSDSKVDIADAVFILAYLFAGGQEPSCLDAADVNDDGAVNIGDAVYVLNYLFKAGPEPAFPFLSLGEDPTQDKLNCEVGR